MTLAWRKPGVVSDTVDGVTIAIDLDSGRYYQFSVDASKVLATLPGISDDVSTWESGGMTVQAFVDELVDIGLLEVSDVNGSEMVPEPFAGSGLSYEMFTDLAHILMLDPIHDVDPPMGWPHADGVAT